MDEGLKDEADDDAMRVLREALTVEPSAGFEVGSPGTELEFAL